MNTLKCQLQKNTTLSYTDAHHTNSQLINSEVPNTTQLPYIQLALQVNFWLAPHITGNVGKLLSQ